jgi:predicted nucleic acid-binding protein
LILENLQKFEFIPLTGDEYQIVIAKMVNLNLTGGSIYDALIAQAALKSSANILLTLNPNHFIRLGVEVANIVQIPQ